MTDDLSEQASEIRKTFESLRPEVAAKAICRPTREGLFRAVLKASFAHLCEYAELLYSAPQNIDPVNFFVSAPLRQCCENLITLKYLAQLRRSDRDKVIQALMVLSTSKASEKQAKFFKRNHPYQPILTSTFGPAHTERAKESLNEVGRRTGLWQTSNRLPPIEQMAIRVRFLEMYEYLYAATSEIVHFNVRIALRSGWGRGTGEYTFSAANFSKFFGQFSRVYAALIWCRFCRAFSSALRLSPNFMQAVDDVEVAVESLGRWPELVTFEEMNVPQEENIILRAFLALKQSERVEALKRKRAERRNRGRA